MDGSKAIATAEWAKENDYGMMRFDYFGHGRSSGDMMQGTIGHWLKDALAVIDTLTTGKLVLVGSSLGGWLMMLAARARPERIAGLIGIAAAPDFTDDLIWDSLTPDQQKQMAKDGQIALPNPYAFEDVIYPYQLITQLFTLPFRPSGPVWKPPTLFVYCKGCRMKKCHGKPQKNLQQA